MESARAGRITSQMHFCAKKEGLSPDVLMRELAAGRAVIPCNSVRDGERSFCAVGALCSPKVNANIGTSRDMCDVNVELEKLRAAEEAGADAVMDLSSAGDIRGIRQRLLEAAAITFGTVPIYEAGANAVRQRHSLVDMTASEIIGAVRTHAEDGVDFVTVHAGVTRSSLGALERSGRICGVVSRGGTFLIEWMRRHKQENPLYERFDEVLDIAREYDVTLSLGDGLRPGALHDAFDEAQMNELSTIAELVGRARNAGVQAMVEGPGHVPLDQVAAQVRTAKGMTADAPLYLLGPVVTDVAPGFDHISAAIGGAAAVWAGADFLCYVTPSEHLRLPLPQDVRDGVIAARVAAHAGEIARGDERARKWDDRISRLRRTRKWEEMIAASLAPRDAARIRSEGPPEDDTTCSMCGNLCVFRLADEQS